MGDPSWPGESPLFCDRCSTELHPGSGDYYRIVIDAVADPAPPNLPAREDPADVRRQIEDLLTSLKDVSAQEALDQVYRRVTLFLCIPCYRDWIEHPTG